MFLFWLWQGRFRTVGIISTIPEPKENYTQGTALTPRGPGSKVEAVVIA